MRNPGGYAVLTPADGRIRECDTFSCGHCNRVTHVPFKCDPAELGAYCYRCSKLICKECSASDGCVPFEERLAREEASYHARRSYGN